MRPALPLPADVLLDLAELSNKHEHLTLARVSKAFNRLYNPVIYRLNYVGSNAKKFVHSLANNPRLPRLVLKLIFDESPDTLVDVEEWAAVLPAMVNPCLLASSPSSPSDFGSELEELRLEADFFGVIPGPTQLPPSTRANLFYRGPPFGRRSLKASDLALLARSPASFLDIRICARYSTRLLDAAPQMLTTLRHILLDEELDWSNFTIDPHAPVANSIKNLAAALTRAQFPRLESILFICSRSTKERGSRRRLSRAGGAYFLEAFKTHLPGPRFRSLRLFAFNGCVGFDNWGSSAQTTTYLGPLIASGQGEGPIDFEWLCAPLATFSANSTIICVSTAWTIFATRVSFVGTHHILSIASSAGMVSPTTKKSKPALWASLWASLTGWTAAAQYLVGRDVPILTIDSGVLKIDIEFCGCDPLASRRLQLISVGLIPSDIANEPGAVELRLLFMQQDEEEERVELKPRIQPKLVLPPLPPRRRRPQPPPDEPPAAPFTDKQQSIWEAGWKDLPTIVRAWSAGELADETLEDDVIPTFEEYLAYAQLLARVERLRQADAQRRKAWELLTSPMWQEHEKAFTMDWYRVSAR
ncbi:hypothetical protein C8F04DRAFT_1281641 [Mycena alexandri]|uniref:Uncharacterized protein n=1 Tax=Mycena alexandri TaxID=1745969 RepID=A0AAD6S009_9AGAR|nr:hypothetical protein C8F04DRAFT_1281641 [Mycena alexandri]